MNKARLKEVTRAQALLAEAHAILDAAAEEEQEAYDNMPESLQGSERGERSSDIADRLREMADAVEEYSNEDFSE